MRKRKLRIYLDTSVISYYTARPHADPLVRSRQSATRRWWEVYGRLGEFSVSGYVLEEISRGDPDAAAKRILAIEGSSMLHPGPESEKLAKRLLEMLGLPHKARMDADARHLAIAALKTQDYIVSWNFRHMANARSRRIYRFVCREAGLSSPEIMTPGEMLQEGAGL